jgi:Tfp pilus assembly protein PilX
MKTPDVAPTGLSRRRPGREGSALLLTVSFVMLTGMVTGALISAAVTHRRMADRAYQRERAFNIAEGGLEAACQIISARGDLLPDPYVTNGALNGGNFYCTIDRTSSFTYALSSTGIVNNVKWVVQARRVEQPSWAKYALWMDINGNIYFIGGESFYGHVHSNTRLYFDETGGDGADFYDRITTATNGYSGTTNGATFAYGLELNADQDSMANVNFTNLLDTATLAGYVVTGHTIVTLTGTTMRVTNQRKGWTNHSITVGTNAIMYVKTITTGGASTNRSGRLMISGRLDGRITFVTDEDVMIRGHLTYATYPTNAGADDAIGLVSRDDIWIDTTMPNNANVHAAMMATGQLPSDNGSFGVVNHSSGSARGDLNVWGSIVQEVRGAVGTFGGSGTTTGYSKKYGFDRRFLTSPPPYYPRLATKLSLYDWREGPTGI